MYLPIGECWQKLVITQIAVHVNFHVIFFSCWRATLFISIIQIVTEILIRVIVCTNTLNIVFSPIQHLFCWTVFYFPREFTYKVHYMMFVLILLKALDLMFQAVSSLLLIVVSLHVHQLDVESVSRIRLILVIDW